MEGFFYFSKQKYLSEKKIPTKFTWYVYLDSSKIKFKWSHIKYELRYSRMDQVKFVEGSL